MKALLAADDSGIIFHWKDLAAVSHNCAGVLRGHSSQVARFALTKNSNTFFSVGVSDRTLIEWQSYISTFALKLTISKLKILQKSLKEKTKKQLVLRIEKTILYMRMLWLERLPTPPTLISFPIELVVD